MTPFRDFLKSKPDNMQYWDQTMDELFKRSKAEIVRLIQEGVKAFEKNRTTCLATDWSRTGMGFTLTQKHCKCKIITPECGNDHWKIVLIGSRFSKDAETRYAPIEGEATAVAYGLKCCKMFVLGHPRLIIAVDHKPLIKILNDRSLDTIENPRLVRIKEKTLLYNYDIIHIPGKSNTAPDAVSRYPTHLGDEETEDDGSRAFAIQQKPLPGISTRQVEEVAAADEECLELCRTITNGFPRSRELLPENLRYYWFMKDSLFVIGSIPFKGRKMLIPKPLRKRILEGLHIAHQGVTGMLTHARERFFWPGLDADISQTRSQCRQCDLNAPSQSAEPLVVSAEPEVPFQQTVSDLCDLEGHLFFIYADRYSGWVEGTKLSRGTFNAIRPHLLHWFTTFGVPEELATDGGPPFNSLEYDSFLITWDVKKRTSSAHYPQSNGRAEAAVKTAKRILQGNINRTTGELNTDAASAAMMIHRNTPSQSTGISPAVALFGRPIKDHLPDTPRELRPEWRAIMGAREQALAKRHLRNNSDQTRRELLPLATGDLVSIQNQYGNKAKKWGRTGRIVEALPNRQYQVVVDGSRHVTLRNRKFLRKIDPICRQPQPTFTTTNAVPFPILTPQRVQEPNPEGHSDRLPTPPSTIPPTATAKNH